MSLKDLQFWLFEEEKGHMLLLYMQLQERETGRKREGGGELGGRKSKTGVGE